MKTIEELCAPLSAKVTPQRCLVDRSGNPITTKARHDANIHAAMEKRIKRMMKEAGK